MTGSVGTSILKIVNRDLHTVALVSLANSILGHWHHWAVLGTEPTLARVAILTMLTF